ncbi:peptidase U62 [Rhizocola hellebori]|uniref:Peptidase U62 n=1 Tax=Rhizocola hellebori TaxID=1392758 RepID=A0A8J3QI31_9ACTN|nr:TldD/PmbA family protein [Rhizocola hellebori]GIH10100.1 peptidase U62 [Rhizocola hellebori]
MTSELTAQVLDAAIKAMPGAQIEVKVDRIQSALTRFANSFIHQNVDEDTIRVGLRVHHEGRTVSVSTTQTDAEALAQRAGAMLPLAPLDPGWPGITAPTSLHEQSIVDEDTRDCTPADRAALVQDFVQAAGGLVTAGYCRTATWSGFYLNSAGQQLTAAATDSAMDGIARLDGADGVARYASARLSDLEGAALGEQAANSVRAQGDPVELPPGRYEVILQPAAVADILNNFALFGFNGKVFTEGRSFAEPGSAQLDPAVTIYDDPTGPAGGVSFDAEGTPRGRMTLVDGGVTAGVTHDRRTAAKAGVASTGHCIIEDSWGPMPRNPVLAPGDTNLAEMIARVERGILVADFWYTRVLDPRTMALTGLTRNGAWLIEAGEIVRPVRNFRFTQSYVQALEPGNVLGIGSESIAQPNRYEFVNTSAPVLHLRSWNFTGGASG